MNIFTFLGAANIESLNMLGDISKEGFSIFLFSFISKKMLRRKMENSFFLPYLC
jgi:hypothetical protein